ncbi:UvrD-helicase domain-containing protein [Methylorubrum sp. SL192]|uniref:UvrD-helicase domain-containing protein n=1 Tax=Methylorubrum sp. SL192 TaxID=2995167 RepID=UPI002274F6EC|nr:UvrD-helicase domain-containing protein [Methylorubrum sp. SL192]MCY1640667.1 UvrD-helicase domain-containing protein [Methylorubrum sp. SL192]
MSNPEIDLLNISRGTITAPAGCGKTHLIAQALKRHDASKPVLVLTHTNAGVAALKARLDKADVPARKYRLATLDGWAMRIAHLFPKRGGCSAETLALKTPGRDYPAIRASAIEIVGGNHIADILAATYSRLIVDEYQDCGVHQHKIIVAVASALPVCALGDPLQAIFGFNAGDLPHWDRVICNDLPVCGELATPWRWRNVGAEDFGQWLLGIRSELKSGRPIDLRTSPANVKWVHLTGQDDHAVRLKTIGEMRSNKDYKVLVIADSRNKNGQQRFASQIPGASTVEAVDLKDLTDFAAAFSPTENRAFRSLMEFAKKVMTEINIDDTISRLRSIHNKTNRTPPSEVETACFAMINLKTYQSCADLLVALNRQSGTRVYRPAVFRACLRALNICASDSNVTFSNAAIQMREANRLVGRPLPSVAVGSTLLLKGLEADGAVILEMDKMDTNNLYVAMTRGAKNLAVCSESPIVNT